jgi:hemoglobin-like flavoprotein
VTSAQERIFAAVEARGYVAGWTPGQFAFRQLVKLVEEVAEASTFIEIPVAAAGDTGGNLVDSFYAMLGDLASLADVIFRDRELCRRLSVEVIDVQDYAAELADVQVVVSCMGQVAKQLGAVLSPAQDFDVVEAALLKATKDVARGTSK